jgi:site-specific DNA-cytosine methylase
MNFLSFFSGCGGLDLGLERAGFKCVGQIENMPFALEILSKRFKKVPKHTDVSTFCAEDGLAKIIQSQVQERVTKEKSLDSGSTLQDAYDYLSQNGFSEKMFPGFYPSMTAKTFSQLSPSSWKSGMAFRGEYLTVNTSESPKNAVVCSLSEVLEESVHPKYYLSKKAVAGILRRTLKHGRSGYVFLQETGKGKTPQMRTLSLQQLLPLITKKSHTANTETKKTSSPKRFSQKSRNSENLQATEETLLHIQSGQVSEELLEGYGKILMLRRLTPNEKEKLQGFPMNWSHPGVSLSEMQ